MSAVIDSAVETAVTTCPLPRHREPVSEVCCQARCQGNVLPWKCKMQGRAHSGWGLWMLQKIRRNVEDNFEITQNILYVYFLCIHVFIYVHVYVWTT